jgi:hypothetical protein
VCAGYTRDPPPAPRPAVSVDAGGPALLPRSPPPLDAADGGLLARKLPSIAYRGGPFLRNPRIVTISFAKDDPKLVSRLELFGGIITGSSWWRAVTEGYCVTPDTCIGDGSAAPPVHLADALPAELRDADVDALLLRAAKAGRLGPLDSNTLWIVYLPKGITLSDGAARYCAGGPRAFHRSVDVDGVRIPFAVLPRCGDEAELTGTASHEILEATTNVFPAERGFAFVTGSGPSGFTAAGLEPVDPCGLVTMDGHWTIESGFVVHRAWSNREASLAHDPCVPSRPELPYVMVVPREPAVRLAHEGDAVTVDLDASAAGAPLTWAISAFDLSGYQDHASYVELSLDKATVRSGDSARLTITSRKQNPKQHEIVGLVSTHGVHAHMWPLLVMMR